MITEAPVHQMIIVITLFFLSTAYREIRFKFEMKLNREKKTCPDI